MGLGDYYGASINPIFAQNPMDVDTMSAPPPYSGSNEHKIPIQQTPLCSAYTPSKWVERVLTIRTH